MLPPTIPTSFVPHSASAGARGSAISSVGIFSFFSYLVLAFAFILAIGIFFYGRILAANESSKSAELAKEEAKIDPATVEGFVRLRDRLASGGKLLAEHIAFSGFFSSLGELMPSTARFSSLHLSIDDVGAVKLEGAGVAKSFNALAAVSTAFAKDGRIKDAIFSNIEVSNKDGSVSFALAATLDPKTVSFSPETFIAPVPELPAVESTSAADSTTSTSSGQASSPQATSSKPTP